MICRRTASTAASDPRCPTPVFDGNEPAISRHKASLPTPVHMNPAIAMSQDFETADFKLFNVSITSFLLSNENTAIFIP